MGIDKVGLEEVPKNLVVKSYDYYDNSLLKTVTDDENRKTQYDYDADGNMTSEVVWTSSNKTLKTEYEYNHLNKISKKKVHVSLGDLEGNDFDNSQNTTLITLYTYDLNGNAKTVETPDGVITTYTYDNLNRQKSVSTPGQDEYGSSKDITTTYTYNWEGKPLTTTNANGNVTQYVYNQRGFLVKTIDANHGITLFDYDRAGRKTKEVSPKNFESGKEIDEMNRKEIVYDVMGRIKSSIDVYINPETDNWERVNSLSYQYDSMGNTIKEVNALGYDFSSGTTMDEKILNGYGTVYAYNLIGKLVTVTDPVSQERSLSFTTKYEYDGLGRKISETNANGAVTRYTYDHAGNLLTTSVSKNREAAPKIKQTNTYDLAGRLTSQKDGNGNITLFEYNGFNQIRKATYPGDETIPAYTSTYQYDVMGRVSIISNGLGRVESYTYDNYSRVLSYRVNDIETTSLYDKNGNKRFENDGEGSTTEYGYDALNRLISKTITVNGLAKTTQYEYDRNNNLILTTDWLGNQFTNKYDPLNRLIEKSDPYSVIQKLQYNKNNVQIRSYDALGNLTQYTYDRNNRLIATIDPRGNETRQSYDNVGNVQSKTDGRNITTVFTYDEFNQLISVTNAKSEVTSYTYDLNGNMLTQTDGKDQTTSYEYNSRNKVVRKIDHGGKLGSPGHYIYLDEKTEVFSYYADGNLAQKTDRNGMTTVHTYDVYGRLESETIGSDVISYTYDNNGNQLTMTDTTGTTVREYDEEQRVKSKTVPVIGRIEFQYDITAGLEPGMVGEKSFDPNGNITLKVYDRAGRMVRVISDSGATTYEYYPNGNKMNVVYPDGARADYSYYPNSKLATLTNRLGDGSILESYSYQYDGAGNQISKTENKGTTEYTYDSLNRLNTVKEPSGRITSYTYDKAGNRLTESVTLGKSVTVTVYEYNEQNRLLKTTTQSSTQTDYVTYQYDNNGNMVSKSQTNAKPEKTGLAEGYNLYKAGQGTTSEVYLYEYNLRNQLTRTIFSDSTTEYAYNGEGLRTKKTVNGQETNYLYESGQVILETDGDNNAIARNVYGTSLISRTSEGETVFYFYNAHGDVTGLIGAGKELLEQGSFTTDSAYWHLHAENGAVVAIGRDISVYDSYPAGYKIGCSSSGTGHSAIQFYTAPNNRVKITAGKKYRLTFRAKSIGGASKTQINLHLGTSPWTGYYPYQNVTIGSTWNTYSVEFIPNASDNNARITFYFGGRIPSGATVYIDSISFREVTDTNNLIASYDYDAFGNIIDSRGSTNNPYTYAGYMYDSESGLYYLNARYYDSKIARFLTEDTYRGQINDPLSLNLYTYCHNNPIRYYDPTGHYVSEWDKEHGLESALTKITKDWETANAKGDKAGMAAAHAAAEAERNKVRESSQYAGKYVGSQDGYTYSVVQTSTGVKYELYSTDAQKLDNLKRLNEAATLANGYDPRKSGNTIYTEQYVKPTNIVTINNEPELARVNAIAITDAKTYLDQILMTYQYYNFWKGGGYYIVEDSYAYEYYKKMQYEIDWLRFKSQTFDYATIFTKAYEAYKEASEYLGPDPLVNSIGATYILALDLFYGDDGMPGASDVLENIGDKLLDSPDAVAAISQFEYIMNTDYRYLMYGSVGQKDFLKDAGKLRDKIENETFYAFKSDLENKYYKNTMLDYIDHIIYMNENDSIYVKSMNIDLRSIKESIDKDELWRINKILLNK